MMTIGMINMDIVSIYVINVFLLNSSPVRALDHIEQESVQWWKYRVFQVEEDSRLHNQTNSLMFCVGRINDKLVIIS